MPGTIDSTVERKRDQQGKPAKDDPNGAMTGSGSHGGSGADDAGSTKQPKGGERKSPRESDE